MKQLSFATGGHFKHLEKKYFHTLQQDCEPPVKGVTIRVAFFAFAILCLGLLSAPVIFLVELVHFWFRKNTSIALSTK
jgi:hypothetical protein